MTANEDPFRRQISSVNCCIQISAARRLPAVLTLSLPAFEGPLFLLLLADFVGLALVLELLPASACTIVLALYRRDVDVAGQLG